MFWKFLENMCDKMFQTNKKMPPQRHSQPNPLKLCIIWQGELELLNTDVEMKKIIFHYPGENSVITGVLIIERRWQKKANQQDGNVRKI